MKKNLFGKPAPRRRAGWWLLGLCAVALLLLAFASYTLSQPQFGGKLEGDRLARARANPQYRANKFVNVVPQASYRLADVWDVVRGQFFDHQIRVPPRPLPVQSVAAKVLEAELAAPSLRAFWIGHASVFVEIDGVRMLIDPIFSDYASPFEFGPKRFQPTPVSLDALPAIDAVLITHDHYDHLDMRTVQHLASKGSAFFVPLGIGAHLQTWGVPPTLIHELEWWQERTVRGVRLVSTPSRHYSGRGLSDGSATLWSSWSVIGLRHSFYVSGDTGYSDHFRAIGERLGPFDLSFIKIGAYGPGAPWIDIHMSAEDAVRAHLDVRARRMFPVHWGTFNLAFHDWDEPIKRAVAAARASQVELLTPRLGEMVHADQPFASNPWWGGVR
jgi:L-ascorbate metabolism protein UlaG (beta-lactamase superfamily)